MILRMQGVFRIYSLRAACLDSAIFPILEHFSARSYYCEEARVIPKSPLLLVQLYHHRWETKTEGTVFGVMNAQGKLLWSHNHENKIHEEPGVSYHHSVLCKILSAPSLILPKPEPEASAGGTTQFDPIEDFVGPTAPTPFAQFEVHYGDSEERVTYHVTRFQTEQDEFWNVVEAKRTKWTLPKDESESPPKNIPQVKAKKLADFLLLDSSKKPIIETTAVALGPEEQIYVLEKTTGVVHVFERNGKPLHLCKPGKEHIVETNWHDASMTVDDQGEVFVRIRKMLPAANGQPEKPNPEGGHFLHFSAKGIPAKELLAPSQKEKDEHWLAQPKSTQFLIKDYDALRLVRRDQYLSQVSVLTHRADGHWFDYINETCFAPDGSFAVRSSGPSDAALYGFPRPFPTPPNHLPADVITFFDSEAKPIRTINFTVGANLSDFAFDASQQETAFLQVLLFTFSKQPGSLLGPFALMILSGRKI